MSELTKRLGTEYDPTALAAPSGRDVYRYMDGAVRCLYLKVSAQSRNWYFSAHHGREKVWRKIGPVDSMTLADARAVALKWRGLLQLGRIPPTIAARAARLRQTTAIEKATTAKVLTDAMIVRLVSKSKAYRIADNGQSGLMVAVTPQGQRQWFFVYNQDYETHEVRLGDWPALSAVNARDLASRISVAVQDGSDLRQGFPEIPWPSLTVGEVFRLYLTQHLKANCAESTARDAELGYERYFAGLLDRSADRLTALDLQAWVNRAGEEHGHHQTAKMFRLLRASLRWAALYGHIRLAIDPCIGVRTEAYVNRERYLTPDECKALETALLRERNQDVADAVRMLLLTGARKSNVLQMEWTEIDFAARVWIIPMEKAKARKSIHVALTPFTMELLRRRQEKYPGSRWVFPADSKDGHMVNIDNTFRRARHAAGLDDVRIHDLRHTVGTSLAIAHATAFEIQKALGHGSVKMSEKYTHIDVEPVREVLEKAQCYLFQRAPIRKDDQAAVAENVVSFARKLTPVVHDRQKNAGITLSQAQEVVLQAKVISCLNVAGAAGGTKKTFYSKIGSQFPLNSSEMERVLDDMIGRGLIRKFHCAPDWQTTRYALCEPQEINGVIIQATLSHQQSPDVIREVQ